MKRIIAVLILTLTLCSCAFSPLDDAAALTSQTEESRTETRETENTTSPTLPPDDAEISLPVYAEADIGELSYDPKECYALYEAEEGIMSGYCAKMSSRQGYSGSGYVTGASLPDSRLIIELEIDSPQHYDVTVCAASDSPVEGILYVDGVARGRISLKGSGEFEAVKFESIYLVPDEAAVSIEELSGECDIDFVLLENSKDIYSHDYSVSGELSNANSSEKTKKLYKYLCEIYGEAVLSGQQCQEGSNDEIDAVARITGRYPAIRFGELMSCTEGVDTGDAELAIAYAQSGGIVGYVWNWLQNGSCYAEKSGFSLEKAVTSHDAAHLSCDKLIEIAQSGGVSEECIKIVDGIDKAAEQLKKLKDKDIPVLFRPLPEAGNGDFWWSSDKQSYLWLYRLIYKRLTEYHGLDNLIWIWNAQDVGWYVGDEYCDIISLDIYDFSKKPWDNQSHITPMLRLYSLAQGKPLAISECNVLPGPANIVKDSAFWLYASVWSGEYVLSADGGISNEYMSDSEWILFYNCSCVIARDELEDFS